jgi:gamma-glutamylcyclotransferase (GGCT)/AIG2-like uncharacterized protein YtfP
MSDHPDLLFVYGTLRRGGAAPLARTLAERARWRGEGHVRGRLYLLEGYPGLVPDAAGGPVRGDVFALEDPASMLALLDDYERCAPHFPEPREYRRARVMVSMAMPEGAGRLEVWTYVYALPTDGLPLIANGRFPPTGA